MKFTLRQLESFVAVARQESVSRAAESLSLSQSAVSMSLNELEKQFDTRLFDRHGKRLQLNELGRQLLPRVQALLDQGAGRGGPAAGRRRRRPPAPGGDPDHRQTTWRPCCWESSWAGGRRNPGAGSIWRCTTPPR